MGLPGYLATNRLSAAATYTAVTAFDATYGSANLYDWRHNKPCRWTGKTSQTLLITFAAPVAIDTIAILKHNFTAAATISLTYGTTNACSDGTEAITWTTRNTCKRFTSATKQYWKLAVSDTGNPANIEIGELVMGVTTVFSRSFSFGAEAGKLFTNDTHVTTFGTRSAYELYAQRYWTLPAGNISSTFNDEIEALYDLVKGDLTPFVYIADVSTGECYLCRLNNLYSAVVQTRGPVIGLIWQSGIKIMEEPDGATVI